jgi:Zc3h12a-like ribonuclease protein/S1 RNA binding family protein
MKIKQLIVDGSNIATEGRSLPSLKQLDEAVRAFIEDNEVANVAVIVDATFGHRIDKSEVPEFDAAVANNEITTPPAGVIGRGDAFILQVADKAGAVVLSNDSFQEFHPQYKWLFDEGRLIGGKPVPGIGWVFTPRVPVRGAVSRRAMKAASTKKASALTSKNAPKKASTGGRRGERGRGGRAEPAAKATKGVKGVKGVKEDKPSKRAATSGDGGRPRRGAQNAAPLNEPLAFIQFVSDHHAADVVIGTVESFSSHGAYVRVDAALCYVPLKAMGDPAPRRARDVLTIGEQREFIIETIDAPRRGIDLSLRADDARATTAPTSTSAANKRARLVDENEAASAREEEQATRRARETATKANTDAPQAVTKDGADHHAEEAPVAPVKKAAKKTARKSAKKSPAKKAARKTAKKAVRRPAKKAAKKRPAKKAAKKSTKKAAKRPAKKAAKRRPAKKAAKRPAKKAARRR